MIDVRRAVVLLGEPEAGAATDGVIQALEWDIPQGETTTPAALVRFQLAVTTEGSAKPTKLWKRCGAPRSRREVLSRAWVCGRSTPIVYGIRWGHRWAHGARQG